MFGKIKYDCVKMHRRSIDVQ